MRAAALAAALALAACQVEVEGAQCDRPGSAEQCPSGQACGNDGRCTERAAACASRCQLGATHCAGEAGRELVETCTDADPVCGTWQVTSCVASGLVCDAAGVAPGCVPVPCSSPGSAEGCPSGQACGNDRKCSAQAAACLSTRCVPGSTRCAGATGSEGVESCTDTDPVCGAWELATSCVASGLVCDQAGHPPACECASPGAELYVDAGAGGTEPSLTPTGAQSPPKCRLGSLAAALDRAVAGTTVVVVGDPATYSGLPLRVRGGVSLVAGDAPFDPASRILENSVADGPGVVLEEGARLAGFTIRGSAGGPRPLAVSLDCDAADKVTLEAVRVDAAEGAILSRGIELRGACAVDLVDVEIAGVVGTGLDVEMGTATAVATMQRGSVRGCETGVALRRGDLRLDHTTIADSVGTGVAAGDGQGDTSFTASDCLWTGNGDTALAVFQNARLDLQDNRICANGASTQRGSAGRRVGGIFVRGAPPPPGNLVFRRNEIRDNAADQVFVTGTTTPWALDASASATTCPADRNLFLGYRDPEQQGRGLVSDAPVTARWNGWAGGTPAAPPLGQDYEALGSGSIDVGVTGDQFCLPPDTTPRPCP